MTTTIAARPGRMGAVRERMRGPGGWYNLGNAVGLAGGLGGAVWAASRAEGLGLSGAASAAASYLAGSGSALALTLATLIFLWGGEVYHRAWADPRRPDAALNRRGDLLSALGALALGLALALVGHPLLAATAGALHALGKLGSALHGDGGAGVPGWPRGWPDPWRTLVLASRGPAVLVAASSLVAGLADGGGGAPVAQPAILLACNALWARADLMLFRPAGAAAA